MLRSCEPYRLTPGRQNTDINHIMYFRTLFVNVFRFIKFGIERLDRRVGDTLIVDNGNIEDK